MKIKKYQQKDKPLASELSRLWNSAVSLARIRSFFLFAIIIISSASFAISIPPSTASAATWREGDGTWEATKVRGEILDHQLYYYAVSCAAQVDIDQVTEEEITKWEWFKTGATGGLKTVRGAMYDNSYTECSNGSYLKEAFSRFGLTDPYDAFCSLDITYSRDGGGLGKGGSKSDCLNSRGRGDYDGSGNRSAQRDAFKKLFNSTSVGSRVSSSGLPDYAKYLRAYASFNKACGPVTYTKAYETGDASGNGKAFKISMVLEDGTIVDVLANTSENVDGKKIGVVATESTSKSSNAWINYSTCGELANDTVKYANAYKRWIDDPRNSNAEGSVNSGNDEAAAGSTETSCKIEKIGWLICPISESIATGVDNIFELVEQFLEVKSFTSGQDGMYNAWASMRNIANVLFVLAFLIIIYSQLTSAGISNYGIKRMLPRLIIAAILVNASYWVTAIATDLSNIIGASARGLIDGVQTTSLSSSSGASGEISWSGITTVVLTGSALAVGGAYAAIGGGAAATTAMLWALVPLIITALFAIFMALFVLAARQALLIVLVVISPLAFVAYLLPNTQKWFEKWRDLFTTLLVMYPIIAVVFGGSQLASAIIMTNANSVLVVLIALTIQVIPLFLLPIIIKFSGGVLGRVAGMANDRSKGVLDRAKGAAKERQELAHKRGVAQGNGMFNRIGRRKDLTDRRRKSQGEQYEAESESRFQRSKRGSQQSQNTAYAKHDAELETKQNTGQGTLSHLNNSSNRALNTRVNQTQAAVAATSNTQKNDDEAEHVDQNPNLYHGQLRSTDNKKRADLDSEANYLKTNEGSTSRIARDNSQGELKIVEGEVENVRKSAPTGKDQDQRSRVVKKDSDMIDTVAEQTYVDSNVGVAQHDQTAELEGNLDLSKKARKDDFENTAVGEDLAVRHDAADKRSTVTTKKAETAAIKANEALHLEAHEAEGEADIAKGDNKNLFTGSDTGIEQAIRRDATDTQGNINAKRTEETALEENADLHVEQQAAQDTFDGTKGELDALIQESRTEEGAQKLGIQANPLVEELQAADIIKRAQSQRSASATNVANQEYAEKVQADSKIPDGSGQTIANVAGGVDAHGATKAKAAATQTIIDDYNKTVGAVKSLNSKTPNEKILGDPDKEEPGILDDALFDSLSTEEIAAQAGLVSSRKHRASQIKLQKKLIDQKKRIESMDKDNPQKAVLQKKLRDVVQQVHYDRSAPPFGVGEQEKGLNEVGEIGVDGKDIYESTRDRIMTHVSAGTLSQMDPDDMRLIYEMGRAGKLGPSQLSKLKVAYDEWEKSPQLKHLLSDKHRALLDPIRTGTYPGDKYEPTFDLSDLSDTGAK